MGDGDGGVRLGVGLDDLLLGGDLDLLEFVLFLQRVLLGDLFVFDGLFVGVGEVEIGDVHAVDDDVVDAQVVGDFLFDFAGELVAAGDEFLGVVVGDDGFDVVGDDGGDDGVLEAGDVAVVLVDVDGVRRVDLEGDGDGGGDV